MFTIYEIVISLTSFYHSYVITELLQSDLHKIIVSPQHLSADHIKVFLYQILRGKFVSLYFDLEYLSFVFHTTYRTVTVNFSIKVDSSLFNIESTNQIISQKRVG